MQGSVVECAAVGAILLPQDLAELGAEVLDLLPHVGGADGLGLEVDDVGVEDLVQAAGPLGVYWLVMLFVFVFGVGGRAERG